MKNFNSRRRAHMFVSSFFIFNSAFENSHPQTQLARRRDSGAAGAAVVETAFPRARKFSGGLIPRSRRCSKAIPIWPASSASSANAGPDRSTGRKCSAASAGCAHKILTSSLTCNASRAAARSPGSRTENFSSASTKSAKARAAFTTSPSPRKSFHTHAVDWYLAVLPPLGVPVHKNFQWLPERPEIAADVKLNGRMRRGRPPARRKKTAFSTSSEPRSAMDRPPARRALAEQTLAVRKFCRTRPPARDNFSNRALRHSWRRTATSRSAKLFPAPRRSAA